MKLHKKGQSMYLVGAIILLIVFIILITALPKIIDVLKKGGEQQLCTIGAVLEHAGKVGGARTFELDCPYDKEQFTEDDLEKNLRKANKAIEKYESTQFAYKEEDPKIWNLNKFVAGEMKQCWTKLGQGELNLFPEWWMPLGISATDEKNAIEFFDFDVYKAPPRFCVICSRIRFDTDIREYVYSKHSNGKITSLTEWMGNNEVPLHEGVSYLEFVEDDVHTGIFGRSAYQYQLTSPKEPDRPLAIIYVQQNVFKAQQWGEAIANYVGLSKTESTPIHSLELIPFDETTKLCTILEG